MKTNYIETTVGIAGEAPFYGAIVDTQEKDWNGWIKPFFEYREAVKAVSNYCNNDGYTWRFDVDRQEFIINPEGPLDRMEIYQVQVILTPWGQKKVWQIVAEYWMWDYAE